MESKWRLNVCEQGWGASEITLAARILSGPYQGLWLINDLAELRLVRAGLFREYPDGSLGFEVYANLGYGGFPRGVPVEPDQM